MIDLDALEAAARAAQDNAYIVQTESFAYARFMKEATPATVLALIARLRAAEAEAEWLRKEWEDMIPSSLSGMTYECVMRCRAEALRLPPPA